MKKYRFILGLTLSVLSTVWLVYLVLQPLAIRSARRGAVALAAIAFCIGIGMMMLDTFFRNPQREALEAERLLLREEILAMLPEAAVSRQELDIYINETLGKIGFLGLDFGELARIKVHLQRKIAQRREE